MMLGRELSEVTADREHRPVDDAKPPYARFQRVSKRRYLAPFDLALRSGQVVALAGLLGSGRTETARLVFGAERADTGTVEVAGESVRVGSPRDAIRLGFGYCPEERKTEGIIAELSVRENIVLALQARRGWMKPLSRREQDEIARHFITLLDIRPADPERPIGLLSGGNQQKALLARWLATKPRLLILDEPTRGIDVGAHADIIRLIRQLCSDGLALLVISSEIEEVAVYADKVVVLRDRKHILTLSGDSITVPSVLSTIAAETQHVA
jgi:simple sugar transport system ATP-binding protein